MTCIIKTPIKVGIERVVKSRVKMQLCHWTISRVAVGTIDNKKMKNYQLIFYAGVYLLKSSSIWATNLGFEWQIYSPKIEEFGKYVSA